MSNRPMILALAFATLTGGCTAMMNAAEPGRKERLAKCDVIDKEVAKREAAPQSSRASVAGNWKCVNEVEQIAIYWQVRQRGDEWIAAFSNQGSQGVFKGRLDGDVMLQNATDQKMILQIDGGTMEGYSQNGACEAVNHVTCLRM